MKNFEADDYQMIKELLEVTNSIKELYKRLYNLECEGKKESEEYRKNLEYLKIAIEVEDGIYDEFDILKVEKMYNFLLKQHEINEHFILKRIVNNINDKFVINEDWVLDLFPEELVDSVYESHNEKTEEELMQFASGFLEVYKSLNKDISEGVLVFLQEYINKNNSSDIKDELIKRKYNLLFTNKKLEASIILNDFNISNLIYSNTELISCYALINNETLKKIKDVFLADEITKEFLKILDGDELGYDIEDIRVYKIIKQCLLRAYFVLVDDEFLSELNYEFHNLIEDEFYIKNHSEYQIGEEIIINSFKCATKDKEKLSILSVSKGY